MLRVLRERAATGSRPGNRTDGHHVVVSIEGGGNRGVIAGGMTLALREHGLLDGIDAVYGSSSGGLTAAWLLSGDLATGMTAWTDPASFATYSRLSNLLRRRPLVDLTWLIEHYYHRTLGLDADAILANPASLHPLATDAATGEAVDLHPFVHDTASLHRALRAGASLPVVAGRPVELAGRRYPDAGLAEAVPLDTPIAAGATHMLVLRSRKDGELSRDPTLARYVTGAWMARFAPGARDAFLARGKRSGSVANRLARHNRDHQRQPAILTVQPGPQAPHVGRMESDGAIIAQGLGAGQAAMRSVLDSATRPSRR